MDHLERITATLHCAVPNIFFRVIAVTFIAITAQRKSRSSRNFREERFMTRLAFCHLIMSAVHGIVLYSNDIGSIYLFIHIDCDEQMDVAFSADTVSFRIS